jgi:hypothetical protein
MDRSEGEWDKYSLIALSATIGAVLSANYLFFKASIREVSATLNKSNTQSKVT